MLFPPRSIHKHVQNLRKMISSSGEPTWVDVAPDPKAEIDECFLNVRKRINVLGGDIQHGWCIWERPGLFIEGEFHGVWKSPNGQLLDVTPKRNGVQRILFVVDPIRTFDETAFTRIDNIRMAISDHPSVKRLIETAEAYQRYKEECSDPKNPRLMHLDPRRVQFYETVIAQAEFEMMNLPIGRNDQCRCGSGAKYKKCCGKNRGY